MKLVIMALMMAMTITMRRKLGMCLRMWWFKRHRMQLPSELQRVRDQVGDDDDDQNDDDDDYYKEDYQDDYDDAFEVDGEILHMGSVRIVEKMTIMMLLMMI